MQEISRERQREREGEGEGDRDETPKCKRWELLVQHYMQLYHRRDDNDSLVVMLSISLVKSL